MATSDNKNREQSFIEAFRQFVEAQLRGEEPGIEEFVRQYPEFEHQFRQKIKEFQKVDSLFDTLVQSDESDFEDTATGQDLVGQKIGSFEIVEIIGRGGMGVVYLAHDTKLKRSVAIKSIPVELRTSLAAQTRFQREAKLLASLNHPNIAVIHEIIEQEEGTSYLVLEYVPGQTLAQRIAQKPLKLEEALSIGQQVAEAVSAAHDKGVIHRDLKPGNIKVTPDGRVKVLDFGLAKTVAGEALERPTTVTLPGRVIGTPAYMSPEQARGNPTDKRSDIWSFGCLLYEMLTGRIPFEGETVSDTLANILQTEPDWQALPQSTPEKVRSLLRRCLEKNPHRRLRDIGDAAIEIRETTNMSAKSVPTKSRKVAMIIGAATIIVLTVIAVRIIPQKQVQSSSKEIRLVVLPFENQDSAEEEYFADGITDEITARLACIHGLAVISRQSAMQYKKREKNARQIADELGVDYILEGTIQRERPSDLNSRVKIRPQLIRAADDVHVWADIYENDMSEVFQLQSDVAERVAQALDITLLEPERRALASKPTQNMEAYEYYLRGNDYFQRSGLENDWRIAIGMYEKAVELDPAFALAYAQLSRANARLYYHYERSEERLTMAKKAVDRAFQLNPDLPEAYLALGEYYYRSNLNFDRALEQFAIAGKSQPNNSELLSNIGFVQRRQGKFEQALNNLQRACELDPLSSPLARAVGTTYVWLRKYPEAERYYNRAISLSPDWPELYSQKAWLYVLWDRSTKRARAVLKDAAENLKLTEKSFINTLVRLDVFDGNYQEALDRLSLISEDVERGTIFIPNAARHARIYDFMNNDELAKKYYDEARIILEAKVQQHQEDDRFRSFLGIAYAGLGREEDAIREGKKGVELLPVSEDAFSGPSRVEDLAQIYVMVGKFDAAIDQLEYLLSIPGELSIPLLQLDPAWDPLRNHPRFQKLLESAN